MSAYFEASLRHRIGNFDLDVELALEREIGVLFGPSAAGKSLTLRLIAGLAHPQNGTVRLGRRLLLEIPGGPVLPVHNLCSNRRLWERPGEEGNECSLEGC